MYRDLGDIETKILDTIIHMGAQDGVQKVSSKKIAKECKIASQTIFTRYGTMRNALDQAAQYFDRKYMANVVSMAKDKKSVAQMWDYFIDCLMDYPDGALYYISYTNVFGFDPTLHNPRAEEFLPIAKAFFHSTKKISDSEYLLIWDYITTMAFYYAEKFIHYMPCTEKNRAMIRRIVFQGLNDFL